MTLAPTIAAVTPVVGTEVIVALLATIGALIGGGSYWQYRISRRKEPIDAHTAEIAGYEKLLQQLLVTSEAADARAGAAWERSERLEGRVDDQDTTIRQLRDKAHRQETRIRRLTHDLCKFRDGWQHLIDHWPRIRLLETPPGMPDVDFTYHEED